MSQIELGRIVMSQAGRDKGRFMIVVGILDTNYVYVADGSLRKIENPKKKNIKHLKATKKRADLIAEKLMKKRKIKNTEIRETLQELVGEEK